MTDSQSNKLDMYIVVNDYHVANLAFLDAVPARALAFGQLTFFITTINEQIGFQSSNTTGVAQDKTTARNTLDNISVSILSPAKAWAISVGNNTLAVEFDYSFSELQHIKDDTITGFCTYRHGLVSSNIAAMADFGITAVSMAQWQAAIDAYNTILATPREAINARHMHTANLKDLFKGTGDLFRNQLDPLMLPLKITSPELYAAYKQARIIIDRGSGSGSGGTPTTTATLSGFVTDAVTGAALVGASISIPSPSAPVALSQADGSFTLIGLDAGEYTLYVSRDGYQPWNTTITLEAGATFELNPALAPIV